MKSIIAALGLLFGFSVSGMAASVDAPYALVSPLMVKHLARTEHSADAQRLIRSAQRALARTPQPLPTVHTEGTLPHQGIYDASIEARRDLPAMRDLAMAYRITGDRKYGDAAINFFTSWLDVYKISLNPVDETHFDSFFITHDLIRDKLPDEVEQKMQSFSRLMALGYLNSAGNSSTYVNNWQSHRVKLIALSAFTTGDADLIERARKSFESQLGANLNADGSVFDFKQRDALHYVVYSLEPLVTAALTAKQHGMNWYELHTRGGASLRHSLRWLRPYAEGAKTHEEFVRSSVRFDAERNKAGVKGFSGLFDTKKSIFLYQMASQVDPEFKSTSDKVGTGPDWFTLIFSQ